MLITYHGEVKEMKIVRNNTGNDASEFPKDPRSSLVDWVSNSFSS